jgi:hypothetical protein
VVTLTQNAVRRPARSASAGLGLAAGGRVDSMRPRRASISARASPTKPRKPPRRPSRCCPTTGWRTTALRSSRRTRRRPGGDREGAAGRRKGDRRACRCGRSGHAVPAGERHANTWSPSSRCCGWPDQPEARRSCSSTSSRRGTGDGARGARRGTQDRPYNADL